MDQFGSDNDRFGAEIAGEGTSAELLEGLGAGGGDLDLLMGDGGPKKSRSGAMILIGVVVLAAGSLFSMRTLTKANAKDMQPPREVENIVDGWWKRRPSDAKDASEILEKLAPVQFVEREAPRNPFGDEAGPEVAPAQVDDEEVWSLQVERASEKLKVSLLMAGVMCNMNGKVVRLGGTITMDGVPFRVTEITTDSVHVVAEHEEQGWTFDAVVTVQRGFGR